MYRCLQRVTTPGAACVVHEEASPIVPPRGGRNDELAEWLASGVTRVSSHDEPGRGPSKRLREASVELSTDEPVELDLDTLRDKMERRAYDELTENEKLVLIWLSQRAGDAGIALERRSLGFDPDELLSALADDVEDEMSFRGWINLPPEAYDDGGGSE